eukprot:5911580-Prorocentrum_lima.AAC.1
MTSSLVGSEMCIRDRSEIDTRHADDLNPEDDCDPEMHERYRSLLGALAWLCLLYTSDAADDM